MPEDDQRVGTAGRRVPDDGDDHPIDTAAVGQRDRARAIAQGIALGKPGDVVLIAGKGHETYQEGAAGKRPFDDLAVALAALERVGREPRA